MKNIYKVSSLLLVLVLVVTAFGMFTTPAKAAVGFRVSGRNLLDVNGNNFIMRGISHAHVWYPNNTASFADIKSRGANTVRVVLGGGRWGPSSASDVANVINLCKTNKLVCVLENHDTTGYGEDGAATSLATAVNYWKSIQSVLTGQENWVIINIGNEPWGNNNATGWTQATKDAIIAMRQAGFQHTLIVDAPNWGQDWQFIMRDNAPSVLASDPQGNTVFSVHMYGVFNTAQEVTDYVGSFVSRGLPLIIGEFGHNHSDGDPDENAIMSTAQSQGIGWMAWSWSGNGGGVEYLDMVTSFNNSSPTSWGTRIFTGANGLSTTSVQCTCYSGGTNPTPTRTNTPGVVFTPTRTNTPNSFTPTRTNTPGAVFTPTRTPTPGTGGGSCTPTSTVTAPWAFDGAGTFCWQIASIPNYINSWNTVSVAVNGTNFTNVWAAAGSLPAKINNNYYVAYNSTVAWGHFEAK
jgi:mannan endo-1,4-beta-mannosidase